MLLSIQTPELMNTLEQNLAIKATLHEVKVARSLVDRISREPNTANFAGVLVIARS